MKRDLQEQSLDVGIATMVRKFDTSVGLMADATNARVEAP